MFITGENQLSLVSQEVIEEEVSLGLSDLEEGSVKRMFGAIDREGTGLINLWEIVHIFAMLGAEVDAGELEELTKSLDLEHEDVFTVDDTLLLVKVVKEAGRLMSLNESDETSAHIARAQHSPLLKPGDTLLTLWHPVVACALVYFSFVLLYWDASLPQAPRDQLTDSLIPLHVLATLVMLFDVVVSNQTEVVSGQAVPGTGTAQITEEFHGGVVEVEEEGPTAGGPSEKPEGGCSPGPGDDLQINFEVVLPSPVATKGDARLSGDSGPPRVRELGLESNLKMEEPAESLRIKSRVAFDESTISPMRKSISRDVFDVSCQLAPLPVEEGTPAGRKSTAFGVFGVHSKFARQSFARQASSSRSKSFAGRSFISSSKSMVTRRTVPTAALFGQATLHRSRHKLTTSRLKSDVPPWRAHMMQVLRVRPNWAYLRHWRAVVDVVSAVPLDIVAAFLCDGGSDASSVVFLCAAHLRILKVSNTAHMFEASMRSTLSRWQVKYDYLYASTMKWFLMCCVLVHALACIWMVLNRCEVQDEGESLLEEGEDMSPANASTTCPENTYLNSVYFVLYSVQAVGYGDIPVDNVPKKVFAILLSALGVFVNGLIVGFLSILLQQTSYSRERIESMAMAAKTMPLLHLPCPFQEEILEYLNYITLKVGTDSVDLLQNLPQELSSNIEQFVRTELLGEVEFLNMATNECKYAIAASLRKIDCEPDTLLVALGEPCLRMYFVAHGFVLLQKDGCFTTLTRGDIFGEEFFLIKKVASQAVRSLTYVSAYYLTPADLNYVMKVFPNFKYIVKAELSSRGYPNCLLALDDLTPDSPNKEAVHLVRRRFSSDVGVRSSMFCSSPSLMLEMTPKTRNDTTRFASHMSKRAITHRGSRGDSVSSIAQLEATSETNDSQVTQQQQQEQQQEQRQLSSSDTLNKPKPRRLRRSFYCTPKLPPPRIRKLIVRQLRRELPGVLQMVQELSFSLSMCYSSSDVFTPTTTTTPRQW